MPILVIAAGCRAGWLAASRIEKQRGEEGERTPLREQHEDSMCMTVVFCCFVSMLAGCSKQSPALSPTSSRQSLSTEVAAKYDQMPLDELLLEAKAAGLNPRVNAGDLQVDNAPQAREIALALYRREREIVGLMDPDALLRRQILGRWKEAHTNDRLIGNFDFKMDGTATCEMSATNPVDGLFMAMTGTLKYKWFIKDGTLITITDGGNSRLLTLRVLPGRSSETTLAKTKF